MTKAQLAKALELARTPTSPAVALGWGDVDMFSGFALPGFGPVTCTLEQLAALLQWQAVRFDGSVDAEALAEVAKYGKARFVVLEA